MLVIDDITRDLPGGDSKVGALHKSFMATNNPKSSLPPLYLFILCQPHYVQL